MEFERESDDQKPVYGYNTHDKGRHFTGEEREEASQVTDWASFPGDISPHILTHEDAVSHSDDGQKDSHEEVGHTQATDQDTKARLPGTSEACPVDKAA